MPSQPSGSGRGRRRGRAGAAAWVGTRCWFGGSGFADRLEGAVEFGWVVCRRGLRPSRSRPHPRYRIHGFRLLPAHTRAAGHRADGDRCQRYGQRRAAVRSRRLRAQRGRVFGAVDGWTVSWRRAGTQTGIVQPPWSALVGARASIECGAPVASYVWAGAVSTHAVPAITISRNTTTPTATTLAAWPIVCLV
jgi:hypothetical protein